MRAVSGLAALLVFFTLLSCQQANPKVSVLWTDIPEMAGYVEKFNASQNQWQILIEYRSDLSTELQTPGRKADLVVSRNLTGSKVRATLTPLSFLFERGGVTKSLFYKDLLSLGSEGDTPLLIPISFNLPVLVYQASRHPDLEGPSLSFSRVRQLGKIFNTASPDRKHQLAFSPRWMNFPVTVVNAMDVRFQEDFRGELTWDREHFSLALAYMKNWIKEDAGGEAAEREFTHKYLQTNPQRLLLDGRIDFYASTLRDFLSLPQSERQGLEFRYPEYSGRIPVEDDVIWAGIPSSALTRGAAQAFLQWFFQEPTQSALAEYSSKEYFRCLGIANGLSPLTKVNEDLIPRFFPELSGKIPPGSRLRFPLPLPPGWPDFRDSVLKPWLQAEIQGKNPPDFQTALDRYYQQNSLQ